MGVMNHNAVIATTWKKEEVERIKKFAEFNNSALFLFSNEVTNGYVTVVLVPDGSKEGWEESDDGNDLRKRFIEKLEQANYDDGTNPWDWIEVGFGEYGQKVLDGNCKNMYNDSEYAV